MKPKSQTDSLIADEGLDVKSVAGISAATSGFGFMASNSKISNNIAINGSQISSSSQSSASSSSGQHLHHGPIKLPVKVTNITTAHQITDTLHHNSKPTNCTNHACMGSIMSQSSPTNAMRNNEDILDQAVEFLEQFFIHHKKPSSSELSQRLAEIATEVERTGTYTLTTDELHFGVRTGWRNASRCIGRIQWNKLELQDARHVRTTQQMFEALCRHISFATNDGNLRSFITVFPQRFPGRDDYRVWNSQLISYAGYQQSDGTVIGDPGRVEFTRICQRLGWKGKNGRFDVLPIVVSAPEEGAKYYDIPEDIILKVKIQHPHYQWFDELALEWYALPAVSEMMFDCGGLQFTGCPFNGWYMGTEIGARDFCDPQRYNITETIAKMMALDISNISSLWKDKAMLEVNIAVLYSYQKAGVTIVDHHSASDSFIKHMNTEYKQRGGCPADWVWIVPPMSGSITSVFHQEMLNYSLRPSFEYQEKAWRTHKWMTSSVKLKYSLISVAKSALWTVRLMKGVLSKRIKATILYATETGKSESFAQKLGKLMKMSFNVQIICMENYDFENLFNESLVLFVVSTFGNGEAPDNGKEFWKNLCKSTQSESNNSLLKDMKYGVFALGSTQYPSFCAFGKNIDKTLKSCGATQVLLTGLGDDLRGQEMTFNSWGHNCYTSSCEQFGLNVDKDISINSFDETTYDPKKVRITEMFGECSENQIHNELSRIHRKKIISCKMIACVRLQANQSERQTSLVRLTPTNPMAKNLLHYEPGDHLAIIPSNPKEIVNPLLGHLSRTGYYADSVVQLQRLVDGQWEADARLPVCSLRTAFTRYLDISSPPTQRFLKYLSGMANDNWDSFRITKLANDIDDYQKWIVYNSPNMADVLNQFPSIHIDPEFLLSELPLLQSRYYSISSSQKVFSDEVHLTVDLVSYHIHDGMGPKRLGICSNFINQFPKHDIPCYLKSAPAFKLPKDKKVPVIMICAGSGIAPFRSFWMERQTDRQNGEECGKLLLFVGCRNSLYDNIYSTDLTELVKKNLLHELFYAFSQEKGHKKLYVQDQVFKQRALLYWLIVNERAHIYVCGHSLMADGVKKSFGKMFENEGKMTEHESQEMLTKLINEDRYHEDVFGLSRR